MYSFLKEFRYLWVNIFVIHNFINVTINKVRPKKPQKFEYTVFHCILENVKISQKIIYVQRENMSYEIKMPFICRKFEVTS